MNQEQMLRSIANLVAHKNFIPMNADCPRCQERETLLDCIAKLLSNAGLSDQVDAL